MFIHLIIRVCGLYNVSKRMQSDRPLVKLTFIPHVHLILCTLINARSYNGQ